MPGGDRTGPWGQGPRTGRGMGYCSGYDRPGFMQPGFGAGMGRGRFYAAGRGFGRGRGRGFRCFAPYFTMPHPDFYAYRPGTYPGYSPQPGFSGQEQEQPGNRDSKPNK